MVDEHRSKSHSTNESEEQRRGRAAHYLHHIRGRMKKGNDTPLSSMRVEQGDPHAISLQFGHPQCVEGRPRSIWRTVSCFCVPGRCLRGVCFALHLQSVGRQVVHHGWDSPPVREKHGCGNKAGECPEEIAELGPRSLESRGRQDLGHSSRVRRVCGQGGGRTIGGGTEVVGRGCLGSLMCSAHGKCWCSAQDPDATTSCAHCHHPKQGEYADGHDLGMMQAMESLC